jgi:peptidoglycan/LPS O-acetylase OafA/YrhL
VRGLAIAFVVGYHIIFITWPIPVALNPLLMGWSGVDLFFVLSGYLIGGILIRHRLATRYYQTFYLRRACRILPLYGLWLLLFVVGTSYVHRGGVSPALIALFGDWTPPAAYATFTQNIAVAVRDTFGAQWLAITWSLAVEEQFYLLMPLAIRAVPPRLLPRVLLAGIALAPLLRVAWSHIMPGHPFALYVLLPFRMDTLLTGVFIAWIMANPTARTALEARHRWLYAALVALLAGVYFLLLPTPSSLAAPIQAWGYSWLAMLFGCLILLIVLDARSVAARLFTIAPLRLLGVLAYGIYLSHQGIIGLCHWAIRGAAPAIRDAGGLRITLAALAMVILFAALSWRFFERPIVTLGHRATYGQPIDNHADVKTGIQTAK